MEAKVKKSSKQIAELILINNDRFEGYKTAANKIRDINLKVLFSGYSLQSQRFGKELLNLLPSKKYAIKHKEEVISGKFHKAFADVKSMFRNKNSKKILSSCEFGEKETTKTYSNILHHPRGIRNEALAIIRRQWIELQKAHFKIRIMQYKVLFMQ